MSDLFWSAVALLLIFEGLLPFMNPSAWRKVFQQMLQMSDRQIRWMGLVSMLAGLLLLGLMKKAA